MQKITALAIFLLSGSAFALMKEGEITMKQIAAHDHAQFYGLRWTEKSCEGAQHYDEVATDWKPLPKDACKEIVDYLTKNSKKLEKEALSKTSRTPLYPGRQLALLKIKDKRYFADLMTSGSCDTEGRCEEPVLSEASKFGWALRKVITRHLGRLAPPVD